ncbi:TIR domain-containing protein [Amycolatopsis sp. NPDC059090]|uniref:TIR domain-containing protein n=1 Tax=unclassified Amycolatopsis TaxID=2618356 RepID=UPI003670613C
MTDSSGTYDVAVSFSGNQRDYVEQVVRACEGLGVVVFYDRDETVRLWGKNVITELRRVYGGVAVRHVIPFLSEDYIAGAYPMDEFYAAMTVSVRRGGDYILPVVMDNVEIPPELLNPAIIYLRAADHSPEELARLVARKVALSRAEGHEPREVEDVVAEAPGPRLPRVAPVHFDPRAVLADAMTRVGQVLERHSRLLPDYGFACGVQASETSVQLVLAENGREVWNLALVWSRTVPDSLEVRLGPWPPAVDGIVTAHWDAGRRKGALRYGDAPVASALFAADEFAESLWHKVVDFIEEDRR